MWNVWSVWSGGGDVVTCPVSRVRVQEPLSPFRRRLVVAAFNLIDTAERGSVSVDAVLAAFHAGKHPSVTSSKRDAEEVYRDFQTTLQCDVGTERVRLPVFEHYYELVSAGVESDDEFQLILWNCWGLGAKRHPQLNQRRPDAAATTAATVFPQGVRCMRALRSRTVRSSLRACRGGRRVCHRFAGQVCEGVCNSWRSPCARHASGAACSHSFNMCHSRPEVRAPPHAR